MNDLLWNRCSGPADLAVIESIPLAERGRPESTYWDIKGAAMTGTSSTLLSAAADRKPVVGCPLLRTSHA
ncbi:AMP-binding protein [Mycolicibacterium mageritense DSM 44476 = CIP 104973]|uniref:Uncharacterized protein n=1 Tax=Mycolicibacterium mageritense TaxID=53462 RepID=A0AAI8XNG6_MYCME|nr:hypothetical protein [Mycolicibacterium mageritense]MCC9180675.1 hypothetical protein [Mycolicibacterium mageritense]TXI61349.1 MAG: hypothetical protein E6Q55_16410 [Mycolicibacterium mageritense]CDO23028.1 hypothetical protein BN978_03507 [Mycolicibacterium mageritense DSM 44476 = CIP 104973]BBX32431.1 hypothetical protein MMAGJ_17130 [Mycolicibacterium mageritense]BDY28900.1 hypothetical protein hbim_02836 [Mycolicibacterium mageritense]